MIFSPSEVASWTCGSWHSLPTESIRGFTIDSRRVRPGDCFVALKTTKRDGHDFVLDAARRGAVAAIVEGVVEGGPAQLRVPSSEKGLQDCALGYRTTLKLPIIGVTGSCGKTSTKDLLALLLGEAVTLSTEANHNNTLGVPLTLLKIDESIHQYAVIEAGINRRGEMDTIASILRPTHAIITMVGSAHSEGLGMMDAIAEEKCKLLAAASDHGVVAFPDDCRAYEGFNQLGKAHVYVVRRVNHRDRLVYAFQVKDAGSLAAGSETFCARDTEIEIEISDIEKNRQRMQECSREKRAIIVDLPAAPVFSASLPAMSEGMAGNAALAVVLALELGLSPDLISARLLEWKASDGRGQVVESEDKVYYVDCYNANPSSMIDTLNFFRSRWSGVPKLYVLGSMNELGEYHESGHREVGRCLTLTGQDQAVFVGDGAALLKQGAIESGAKEKQLYLFSGVGEARELVDRFKGAVLLKGSRSYGLERLLPTGPGAIESEAVAC